MALEAKRTRHVKLFLVAALGAMALNCPEDNPTSSPSISLHFSPSEVERGKGTTAILTRSMDDGAPVVALSTPAPGIVSIPASVTMPAGELQVSFPVLTAAASTAGSVTISATTTVDGETLTASAQLFLRDPDDPVAPLRIESAALDNDDVIGGDEVGVTVRFTRRVRDGDRARLRVTGTAYWPFREFSVPTGVLSTRLTVLPREVDDEVETLLSIGYRSVQAVHLPITLLPRPKLTSMAPAAGLQGETLTVTLSGRNLTAGGGTTVLVSGSDVTVSNLVAVDRHTLTATFAIGPFAAVGARNVTVRTNHGMTRAVTFTVNPG